MVKGVKRLTCYKFKRHSALHSLTALSYTFCVYAWLRDCVQACIITACTFFDQHAGIDLIYIGRFA